MSKKAKEIASRSIQLTIAALDIAKGITAWLLEWIAMIGAAVLTIAAVRFAVDESLKSGLICAVTACILMALCYIIDKTAGKTTKSKGK